MPTLRRLSLGLALLFPVLLGPAGGAHPDGGESDAAVVATDVSGHANLRRGQTAPAQAYLGSTSVVLSFPAPQDGHSARTGVGPIRGRHARDPYAPGLLSNASRARSARLARLDFANLLDGARSGHRSVHSTTVPPPHNV